MLKRAQNQQGIELYSHNLRDWAEGKHKVTDDTPYGGGQGMVMKPEPIFRAVEALETPGRRVILMSPRGKTFSQPVAQRLCQESHLIFICGHYEGVDERVSQYLADEEISIGDFILTNGALAAAVVTDAVIRLLPGVLGHELSAEEESFSSGMLEFPQYTKPSDFRGYKVPDVLLSGHHAEIEKWRKKEALKKTRETRPDLLNEE